MKRELALCVLALCATLSACSGDSANGAWQRQETPIITRWGSEVTPDNAWREYPRPQLVREEWQSLNGLWDYALSTEAQTPSEWSGKILVPYPIQSALSGVAIIPEEDDYLWYRREFKIPKAWGSDRIILNFEAVDFEATVWVNGQEVGSHKGSYNAFSFDITKYLDPQASNELVVRVLDKTDITARSVGKQTTKRNSEYENLTGIWQSVWLEPVNTTASINSIYTETSLTDVTINVSVDGAVNQSEIEYLLKDGNSVVATTTSKVGERAVLKVENPKLWSPESPFLYDLEITLKSNGDLLDRVESYCGMRTIEYDRRAEHSQILLNGEPIFQMGPLDQNYWPESGLTPPSSESMRWEVDYLRSIGCNMVRLHIKRNPRLYYYHCDKEGLLVWQDFICGRDKEPSREHSDFWLAEQAGMVDQLYNHPSIVMWVVFNEAWGQHDSERVFATAEKMDDTRIFSVASGWNDVKGAGAIRDLHDYSFAPSVVIGDSRAVVLGECGGFASAVPPHNWLKRDNVLGEIKNPLFGGFTPSTPRDTDFTHDSFRPTFTYGEAFDRQYERFVNNLYYLKASGLVGAVYTQLTDMKSEENGWLTFDREVSKVDVAKTAALHAKLYGAAPVPTILSSSSYTGKSKSWEYSILPLPKTAKDEVGGYVLQKGIDLDALKWRRTKSPFSYGMKSSTDVKGWAADKRLVVKGDVKLKSVPERMSLRVYSETPSTALDWMHSRIYINGEFVMDETTRHESPDELKMSEVILNDRALELLKKGSNTIVIEIVPGVNRGAFKKAAEAFTVDFELVSWSE